MADGVDETVGKIAGEALTIEGMQRLSHAVRGMLEVLTAPPEAMSAEEVQMAFLMIAAAMSKLLGILEAMTASLEYERQLNEQIKRGMN